MWIFNLHWTIGLWSFQVCEASGVPCESNAGKACIPGLDAPLETFPVTWPKTGHASWIDLPSAHTNFCLHLALRLCSLTPASLAHLLFLEFIKGQSCLRVSGLAVPSSWNVLSLDIHMIVLSSFRSLLSFSTFPLLRFIYLHYIYHHLMYVFIIYLPLLKYKLYTLDFVYTNVF